MALRPRFTAGLPFAPKHWQIHHRPYIDRTPETLIPEIWVPYSENFVRWTCVRVLPSKIDESGLVARMEHGEALVACRICEPDVIGKK
jgi:hypothetical protein